MLSSRSEDLPARLEGPPTYEIPESRKALLTKELEKRKTGGELVSFGFSASNACNGWIPLHHRSGSAIQPEKSSSPRVRWAKFSSRVVSSTRSQNMRPSNVQIRVHIRCNIGLWWAYCSGTIAARDDPNHILQTANMADVTTQHV